MQASVASDKNPKKPLTGFSFEGDTPGKCRRSGDTRGTEPQKLTGPRVLNDGAEPWRPRRGRQAPMPERLGLWNEDPPEWLRESTVSHSWGQRQGVRASQGPHPGKPAAVDASCLVQLLVAPTVPGLRPDSSFCLRLHAASPTVSPPCLPLCLWLKIPPF